MALRLLAVFLGLSLAGTAHAKEITLRVPPALVDSGLMQHLLPRFSLKTQIRVQIVAEGSADAVLSEAAEIDGRAARRVFHDEGGAVYHLLGLSEEGDAGAHTARFTDWLTGEVGQRTIDAFEGPFVASVGPAAVVAADLPEGDVVKGGDLSLTLCGRCHVIDERNRMNGLGSTPSFGALRALGDWQGRFEVFYVLNPHPSFTQIADLTPPFDPARPSPIAPMEMTLDDLDAILAFVGQMPPLDLGAPVEAR